MTAPSIGTPLLWIGFLAFVLAMLALDLFVVHRNAHAVRVKEAALWSTFWIALALLFNGGVWALHGPVRGLEFLTGYLVEKALSVDNLFVFLVLFRYFQVPREYQHRVLFWGILGAIVMRAVFVFLGAAFMERFHWAVYVFGGLLAVTGVRLLVAGEPMQHPEKNLAVRLVRRVLPLTHRYQGAKMIVVENGRRMATPLLLTLLVIELTDVLFAVDSVPAVFAVTRDPFIVFTSNIFAILGLRALYFLLAGVMDRFHHLKFGLALVLVFVGAKMLLADVVQVPIGISLAVIATLIAGSIVASLIWRKAHVPAEPGPASTSGGDSR
jgi:tellurite resistance protein TerC